MEREWTQESVQLYIDEEVEENLNLDYKAADALAKTDGKKREITKDVSAMANSDGGIVIYGVKERQDQRHLPEGIDPVDRTRFSKEWLEQIINTIRPRIDRLVVHPVPVDTRLGDVVYVVEIPQSTTAHQARDWRYYKRFNFESVPMEDYEIRDVMNRSTKPNLAVSFGYRSLDRRKEYHECVLEVAVKNLGERVVQNLLLEFSIPSAIPFVQRTIGDKAHIDLVQRDNGDPIVAYRCRSVLFPEQELDIGSEIRWTYQINRDVRHLISRAKREGWDLSINWTLYADDMKPKRGSKSFSELHGS